MNSKKKILVLTDTKAGHENQSRAFVRFTGLESDFIRVKFKSFFAKALSYLFDFFHIRANFLFTLEREIERGEYAVVLGTGSGTFYPVKTIANQIGAKSAVILYPRGYRLVDFDCILAPSFDKPRKLNNILELPANISSSDDAFYAQVAADFDKRHKSSGKKAVAVILGGPNSAASMSASWVQKKLSEIFETTKECEHWITTSRRTPKEAEAAVRLFPFDYCLIYSEDHFNPIPAFVEKASRIFVSAESTGMISEAVTRGSACVEILDNFTSQKTKFARFVKNLEDAGAVNVFDGEKLGSACVKLSLTDVFNKACSLLGL